MNPLVNTTRRGLVPMLESSGQFFAQSLAIIEYLDELHPEPPLLPSGTAQRARVRGMAHQIAMEMHPLNNLRVLKYLENELGLNEEKNLLGISTGLRRVLDRWKRL